MNKEQQDRLWNALSESKRTYLKSLFVNDQNDNDEYLNGYLGALIDMFGEHNLNPKPTPKTWEDVEKKGLVHADTGATYLLDIDKNHYSKELALKALATLQIAKLIEISYGGMVSEEEWEDDSEAKYVITCSYKGEITFEYSLYDRFFIAFHTPEQREEFMSYESNRKLVEMYHLM